MPLEMQAKLLRVLQDKVVVPVGGQSSFTAQESCDLRNTGLSFADLAMSEFGELLVKMYPEVTKSHAKIRFWRHSAPLNVTILLGDKCLRRGLFPLWEQEVARSNRVAPTRRRLSACTFLAKNRERKTENCKRITAS